MANQVQVECTHADDRGNEHPVILTVYDDDATVYVKIPILDTTVDLALCNGDLPGLFRQIADACEASMKAVLVAEVKSLQARHEASKQTVADGNSCPTCGLRNIMRDKEEEG